MSAGEIAERAVAPPLLVELLTLAQRRLTRTLTHALAEEDCTFDQWLVLRALGDGEGRLMGDLAQRLLIPHASLTRIVDALVDDGWIYRRQSGIDRRRIAAHLSRRGHDRLTRLNALAEAHESAVRTACASEDPATLLAFLAEPRTD
ncbi:MarR family winged helix-turn-helix transcriptional regulator [Embleya sp. NPDC020886]|uniref:MarR family winged helix-turn-helix transcriptional regulator n=1 Tax=Embleya sp. NPDC020886 TaxID=3363980 RepID=UPI0037947350